MTDDSTPHRTTPDRLRDALAAHAETIEPSSDGLDRIEERLMTGTETKNPRWTIGAAAVAAALLIGVVAFVATNDGDTDIATGSTSTTSTSAPDETTTTESLFTPDVDPYAVAYPSPLSSQRFDSSESAGLAYARDVLGFTEVMIVEYRAGDSRSGEVVITDRPGRIETAVLVRQMDDDTWFVLGSQTENIVVETPTAGSSITSPFDTSGVALAFEGTVDVIVRTQDDPKILGEGFVTGSGTPPAGPFSDAIEFDEPDGCQAGQACRSGEIPGIVVFRVHSAEDGHVTEATSFRINLKATPAG